MKFFCLNLNHGQNPRHSKAIDIKNMPSKFKAILQLIRFDRPIGSFLLLWPTLTALWLAAGGLPDGQLLAIFGLGFFLMRSAGCAINDFADRHVDGAVTRTNNRPLVIGQLSPRDALLVFTILSLTAFGLVLLTNTLTVMLSLGAVILAAGYPFIKRYTHLPQFVLGAAYSCSIPMAFAAHMNELPPALWWLYTANLLWTVSYDTLYAMVDREEDVIVGIKSTAILFGKADRAIVGLMQVATVGLMLVLGNIFQLGLFYLAGVMIAACLFIYQQYLIRHRLREKCFQAFLNNNYVGLYLFSGTALDYLFAV